MVIAKIVNDLTDTVQIHTYNGEDLFVHTGLAIPFKTYTVQPRAVAEVEAFAWASGIHLQLTYRGISSSILKSTHNSEVKCSELIKGSPKLIDQLQRYKATIVNDLPHTIKIRYGNDSTPFVNAFLDPNQSKEVNVKPVTTTKPGNKGDEDEVHFSLLVVQGDNTFLPKNDAVEKVAHGKSIKASDLKKSCSAAQSSGGSNSMRYE